MSAVYATEPAPSGRVIFETTHGPLDAQLFCRECPTFTKLFLQLCVDGFYDNMIFHRITPKFIIQTGLLRKPQSGSVDEKKMKEYWHAAKAEVALERRKYETHSRLRFSHRGLVAMALGVDDDPDYDVLPQFFITLDEAQFLDGKHVIFGSVDGPTIFNALRIGGIDVDSETSQPTDMEHAPRIQSVRIVENPMHQGIVAHPVVPWKQIDSDKQSKKKKKKKRKGKLDVNVLSFGDEMGDAAELSATIATIATAEKAGSGVNKSSSREDIDKNKSPLEDDKKLGPGVSMQRSTKKGVVGADEEDDKYQHDNNNKEKPKEPVSNQRDEALSQRARVPPESATGKLRSKDGKDKELLVAKKNDQKLPSTSVSVSIVEMRKAKYAKGGRKDKRQREADTMSKLLAFKSKVKDSVSSSASRSAGTNGNNKQDNSLAARMALRAQQEEDAKTGNPNASSDPGYHGQVLDDDDMAGGGDDWLQTRFKCRRHMDHDDGRGGGGGSGTKGVGGSDGRNMYDYEVVDDRDKSSRKGHHHKRHKKHHHRHHRSDR